MKQIPNLFTLLNLIFGCIAIVLIMQTNESIISLDNLGATQIMLPERLWEGSLFIFGAAIIDFLDGFLARLFRATSDMGKQLDSLSDVVSFGVAPGMIIYQLLRMSYAQQENGLNTPAWLLVPSFIFSAAAAWRLAKFNISSNQTVHFRGVPSPAAGLLVASFPLILSLSHPLISIQALLINKWVLYLIVIVISYLMICNRPFMALKFKDYSIKNNGSKYLLLVLSLLSIILLQWMAIPAIFILYVIISLFIREPDEKTVHKNRDTLDMTV